MNSIMVKILLIKNSSLNVSNFNQTKIRETEMKQLLDVTTIFLGAIVILIYVGDWVV